MLTFYDLFFQQAPIALVLDAIANYSEIYYSEKKCCIVGRGVICHCFQRFLINSISSSNHSFLISNYTNANIHFEPPASYRKALFKAFEKLIHSSQNIPGEQDTIELFSEELAEAYMRSVNESMIDANNSKCFVSYRLMDCADRRVPLLIQKSHNQVGTKVWGAGLYLAELLQSMAKSHPTCFFNRSIIELGAGVGVTSILFYQRLLEQSKESSAKIMPKSIIITDYPTDVMNILHSNIQLACPQSSCEVIGKQLDWNDHNVEEVIQTADCLLAADCTYSEDLNIALVQLFISFLHMKKMTVENVNEDLIPEFCISSGIPCIVLACTIRQPETFQHLLDTLAGMGDKLLFQDVTDHCNHLIDDCNGHLYHYDFKESIRLLLIVANPSYARA